MKTIAKQKLAKVLSEWSKEYDIIAPLENNGSVLFGNWDENKEVDLSKNADISPKEIFFPRTEKLYKYEKDKEDISIESVEPTKEKFIIFGIRPCDLHALDILDDVFIKGEFIDAQYKSKREQGITIAYLCLKPEKYCFCNSLEIDYQKADSADMVLIESEDNFGFICQTQKGEDLLKAVEVMMEDIDLELPGPQEQLIKVDINNLDKKLADMFEHEFWGEVHNKCIGCGICTYICPTCHCFDMNTQKRGKEGFKTRTWDSCMFPDYTLMAGGHNPRPTMKERFRNRFLHKLQYFPEIHGKFMCVGCGRCINKCPVNVDITKIIADLKEVEVVDN